MAVRRGELERALERAEGALPGARRALLGAAAVRAAIGAGEPVRRIVARRGALSTEAMLALSEALEHGIECRRVSGRELARLLPPGSDAALLGMTGPDPAASIDEALALRGAAWLLVGVAYPRNAGVVIRSAEVAGADLVVVDSGFDRRDRRECLRASMRSDRWLPVRFASARPVIDAARGSGKRIVAVESPGDARPCTEPWVVDLRGPVLFLLGGEQEGLPASLLDGVDETVRIPMPGFVPSYNLQAAAAIVMGERLRQQQEGDTPGNGIARSDLSSNRMSTRPYGGGAADR